MFAIAQGPFIVYTSNIFAILGLRALYFAFAALMHRFVYLKYALAIVLIFIGGKIFLHGFFKVPTLLSLSVTLWCWPAVYCCRCSRRVPGRAADSGLIRKGSPGRYPFQNA